jgi:hypothetical protein
VARKKKSMEALRGQLVETNWDEIKKMAMGLQSGQLDAFEMYGAALADLIDNAAQADMHMAVLFEVLPPATKKKLLSDERLQESETVLPIIASLPAKRMRPKKGRG